MIAVANWKGKVPLQPKPQAEPISWNDFCRLVLKIVEELSPCPEPRLFIVAAHRELQRFGDGTLEDLRKHLGQCVEELKTRGLLEINGSQLIAPPAGRTEHDDILDLTADVALQSQSAMEKPAERTGDEGILELTADFEFQPQFVSKKPTGRAGDEDILELTAALEPYELEDFLELTAELELHPSLQPSKLDKAPRDQEQLRTQAPVTGRPKSVSEPTREEIIAAMRRFVSEE
jgi:hypothetical protein